MNLSITLSICAILCGFANITFITVYLCRQAWRESWKYRYRNFWHRRYLRNRRHA